MNIDVVVESISGWLWGRDFRENLGSYDQLGELSGYLSEYDDLGLSFWNVELLKSINFWAPDINILWQTFTRYNNNNN